MNVKKLALPALILGLIGYVAYSKYRLATNAVFTLDGVAVKSVTPFNVELTIGVLNTTSTSAVVGNLYANVSINNQFVGELRAPGLFDLAGNEKSQIVIGVTPKIDLMTAANILFNYLQNKSLKVGVRGNVEIDGITFPLNI